MRRVVLILVLALFGASCAYGWGAGGGINDGSSIDQTSPTVLPGLHDWAMLSGGTNHSCGIDSSASLFCWGTNFRGQLGLGDTENRAMPTRVDNEEWRSVSAGGSHTCGIRSDATLWCWGNNYEGTLGLDDRLERSVPTPVGSASWSTLTGGSFHTCGIQADASLWCWGTGRLGTGGFARLLVPTQIGTDDWSAVSTTSGGHTCGIQADASLWCWGNGGTGRLGLGDDNHRFFPTRVGSDDWLEVSPGGGHTCGIRSDNFLWCWGWGDQVGDGSTGVTYLPTQIGASSWLTVSAGNSHTCGTHVDRSLWCWGQNDRGQIGDGTTDDRPTPVRIAPEREWAAVAAGSFHSLAIPYEPEPEPEPSVYVALGDSYSSGHGAPPYDQGNLDCRRSDLSWAALMSSWSDLLGPVELLACSGAETSAWGESFKTEPPQQNALALLNGQEQVDVVTLTFGGNDLGFSSVLKDCVLFDCAGTVGVDVYADLPRVESLLDALLQEVRTDLPNARIVLVGYPRLFPETDAENTECGWLEPHERSGLNGLSSYIDLRWEDLAESAGIEYLSTLDVFDGFELCRQSSVIVELLPEQLEEDTGHPNASGQQLMAAWIQAALDY